MGARIVTNQEFKYVKELLEKDHGRVGSKISRVAKKVRRSIETVRLINIHKTFQRYVYHNRSRVRTEHLHGRTSYATTAHLSDEAINSWELSQIKSKVASLNFWFNILFAAVAGLTAYVCYMFSL
jgi:hypothetical protein